ncbi:MAG TPA: protein-methionine-sulfoxide reductase catalytic subunit MsrP [Gammaproteobacteria bacterium]|nr:protein-methionine-sulfoxide reductase catalytic subunit MsrP [Gammaproteobacteria bacterium]
MLIKRPNEIKATDITDEKIYHARREFLKTSSGAALTVAAGAALPGLWLPDTVQAKIVSLQFKKNPHYVVDEDVTSFKDITRYNNFYEFGTDKKAPAKHAHTLKTDPWTVRVEGEVEKPADYHLEDIIRDSQLEERIYRFRCVEAWSMVIPWVGIPLATLIKRFKPTSKAKYVEFITLYDPEQMPGQRRKVLDWPYVEGLRMDEAMHPLTLMAVGLYGKVLPKQNGAPIRLVVPWKYGFKNIKSIVKIRFTETQPRTTWNLAGPREYGFYANVNPEVDHPRWSQRRERRIGEFFKRKTLMFNGYAEQVAGLYAGMDLRRNY